MKTLKIFLFLIIGLNIYSQKHLKTNSKAGKINITNWIKNEIGKDDLKNKNIALYFINTVPNTVDFDFIENLNGLQSKIDKKNLIILTILIDDENNVQKQFFKNREINFSVGVDSKKIAQRRFGNKDGDIFLPLTILIDNKGFVKWIGLPYFVNLKLLNDFINGTITPYNMFDKQK